MALSDDFDEKDLAELARLEGKSVDEVKKELLRERLLKGGRKDPESAPATAVAKRAPDALGREERDERGETAEEAMERWLEEEASLPDGVHGLGGQSAGGIFGDGPIATSIYDPQAMGRSEARQTQQVNIKLMGLIDRLTEYLPAAGPPRALPGGDPRRLPPRRR